MLERDRERNISFKNFQGALQIEAPKTPPAGDEQTMSNQEPAPDWLKPEKAREVQTPATGKKHLAKRTTRAKNGTPKVLQKGKDNEQPKKGIFGRLFGK